ncbi:MAG TPA: DUF721 domain-containing protein [Actinomycetota bacterium]|nr:DUF721 domain-containing protein [Actinomycetota bacterium]
MSNQNPLRLRDLLQTAGARLGLEGAVETGALWSRWSEVVGEAVASHAEPTSLKGGVLRIRTDSPTWATEIGYLADEIKARANRVAGRALVSEVRVWTSPDPIRTARVHPSTARQEGAQEPAPPVADTDPDAALARAREAWRKRRSGASS